MTASIEELESLLQSLEDDRPVVAYALRRAAEGLRGRGRLTVASALEGAGEFRARFDALQRRAPLPVREIEPDRRTAGTSTQAAAGDLSLPELRRRLEEFRQRARTRQTIAVLRRVQAATPAAAPAVERIRSRADEWESQLESTTREAAGECDLIRLRDDENPALALVNLVRHRDALSDPEWDACVTLVRGTFGDGVATAVIRGRLILPPESQPATGVSGSRLSGSAVAHDAEADEACSPCSLPGNVSTLFSRPREGTVADDFPEQAPSLPEFQVQR